MRLDIRYRTSLVYDGPVTESQNELRACPISDERQTLVAYRLTVRPSCRVLATVDAWGTHVDHFGLLARHDEMEVIAEAAVETREVEYLGFVAEASLDDRLFRDAYMDFLLPTGHTRLSPGVQRLADEVAYGSGTPDELARAVSRTVGAAIEYEPGTTAIGIDTHAVLEGGVGVCQDYAHVAIAVGRAVGLPSRYVSGYFFAADDASGDIGEADEVRVQTHAWVEFAIPGRGWLPQDPTNQVAVGLRHVKIGHGQDYDDVLPLRGVYCGSAGSTNEVVVEMRRMDRSTEPGAAMRQATVTDHHRAARDQQQAQQAQ